MAAKQYHQKNVDPIPPSGISKANLGIWIGWTYRSDRELIREAVAKGHVPLAVQFLKERSFLDDSQASALIKNEALLWVDELLKRKLIFRVSSILENISLDATKELQNMFYKTANGDLREYIGSHLLKNNTLPEKFQLLWHFLEIILANRVLTPYLDLDHDSIEILDQKDDDWKHVTATKLFLNTHDTRLLPLLTTKSLWEQLFKTNSIDLIIFWIQVSFIPDFDTLNASHIPDHFLEVFKRQPITEDLFNTLPSVFLPSCSNERILDELAQLGIFVEHERCQFLRVLERVEKSTGLINLFKLLGRPTSNLSLDKFILMLVDYCLDHDLPTVLNACSKGFDIAPIAALRDSPYLSLMVHFRNLVPDFDLDQLRDNIFKVSKYLSDGNLENYFCDNPLVFLSLLFLSKNISIESALGQKSLILYDVEVYQCLTHLLKKFNAFSSVYIRKTQGVKSSLTYLDLLEKHSKIDVRKSFSFYFEGKPMLTFNSPELKQFAYSKKVNYTFYLRQCRPSFASKVFYVDLLESYSAIKEEHRTQAIKKVFKLAFANFDQKSFLVSCISFLDLIGVDCSPLRVSIKAAKILSESGMEKTNIKTMFLDDEKGPRAIQMFLDEYLVKQIDFDKIEFEMSTPITSTTSEFLRSVQMYEVLFRFSQVHNLTYPECFLYNLTQRNLWFPFLLYAQIKNYPVHQIRELCASFKNPNLLEHMVHCVMHDIQVDETNVLMRERDPRKYFLSKLGVRRSLDQGPSASGSLKSRSTLSGSMGSSEGSISSDVLEIDPANTKATLLQTLIRCHNSTDPPRALLQACQLYRNPLLAILATSYEPDSVIINWLTWLAVSTDLYELFTNFEAFTASAQQVIDLLDNCMRNRFPKTILQSCMIFIPDNPLTPFMDFLCRILKGDQDPQFLLPKLEKFKKLKSSRRASVLSQTDYEMTYLKNKVWIETTSMQLLCSAIIYNTDSHFEQQQIVEVLCKIHINEFFSCEIPNFHKLFHILHTVFDTSVKLNLMEYFDATKSKESTNSCVDKLINEGLFEEGLQVAKIADLDTDVVVLRKWQNNFEHKQSIDDFLESCDRDFVRNNIAPEYAVSFFKERVGVDDLERYYLLKYAHKWASKNSLMNQYELERKKIIAFAQLQAKAKHVDVTELTSPNSFQLHTTYKEMLDIVRGITKCAEQHDNVVLEAFLVDCLGKGNFWMALKLEAMFGCRNSDLDILKLCHGLAEGLVLPHQLTKDQQELITRVRQIQKLSFRRRSLSYKSTSFSSDQNYIDFVDKEPDSAMQDTLGLIHSLIEKLTQGAELAYSVFMKYRISCNIEVPYEVVVSNTDYVAMLKDALKDDCMNKSEVVHDFLEVFPWSKDEVTDFICEQFVSAASSYAKSRTEGFTMWDINVDQQFHLILKLIKEECSTLGHKLYNFAKAVHEQQATADLDFKISEMSLVVELLIASHSCFTADCNMEGISTVLKKCRKVIAHLLTVRSWKLIVRLLTGVGRYTELNFIFHVLKEHDQFEFLLSKASKRDERLKLACLEYLKKYCPKNKELYKLVALHFNLYSEIATILEREAQDFVKNLIAIAQAEMENKTRRRWYADSWYVVLTKSDGTKQLLDKAMQNYVLASEYHMQGNKYQKATNSTKQAELIALQFSLLRPVSQNDTVPCVLSLIEQQVFKMITEVLDFQQSYLLAQIYGNQPDWSQILYERTVLNGDSTFFEAFAEVNEVHEDLVEAVSKKFLHLKEPKHFHFANVRKIVEKVTSNHAKYRLASELAFTSLCEELVAEGEISYLKDTVWKKGYGYFN